MTSLLFIMATTVTVPTTVSTPDYSNWYSVFTTVIPYLTCFGLVWKCIDKVFEYMGRKSKEQVLEVMKAYVTPQMDLLQKTIDELREERRRDNEHINDKLKDIREMRSK